MARRKMHKQYWRLTAGAGLFKGNDAALDIAARIRLLNAAGSNMGEVAALKHDEIAAIERLNKAFTRRRQMR